MPGSKPALLAAALALTIASGCSPRLSPARDEPPPELRELYANVHECRRDYETGLALIVDGQAVVGRNVLAATTDRIGILAEECARTEGCDSTLFLVAIEQVIEEHRERLEEDGQDGAVAATADPGSPAAGDPHSAFVSAIPEIGRTVSLLHGTDLRDLITLNEPVKAALNDWLTWNRPQLVGAYVNYQFLRDKIAPIYEEAELPEALLFAMIAQESGGKVHAYSRAGAAGPLQFMRRTGRRYGLGSVDGFDMRLDPEAATRANVAFLNDQFKTLNNDLEKTLAAYNGGESRLRGLHRKLDGAKFWDPRMYNSLPTETQDYVPRILAAAWLFLHTEDYGIEFPVFETNTTTIVLSEEISLGELTTCLGTDHIPSGLFRTLRNLNPRLKPGERIPAGDVIEMPSVLVPAYAERCIGDSPLLARARDLHDASYPE